MLGLKQLTLLAACCLLPLCYAEQNLGDESEMSAAQRMFALQGMYEADALNAAAKILTKRDALWMGYPCIAGYKFDNLNKKCTKIPEGEDNQNPDDNPPKNDGNRRRNM